MGFEMILGVVEDLLDRLDAGGDDGADAKNSLTANKAQFTANLKELADGGNADAAKILERLNSAGI